MELVNLAWSCATIGYVDMELLEAIAVESKAKIAEFQPFNLSIMAWAMAKLCLNDATLLDAIAAESMELLASGEIVLRSQELANTAWAYATLGVVHGPLLDSIAQAAITNIQ